MLPWLHFSPILTFQLAIRPRKGRKAIILYRIVNGGEPRLVKAVLFTYQNPEDRKIVVKTREFKLWPLQAMRLGEGLLAYRRASVNRAWRKLTREQARQLGQILFDLGQTYLVREIMER